METKNIPILWLLFSFRGRIARETLWYKFAVPFCFSGFFYMSLIIILKLLGVIGDALLITLGIIWFIFSLYMGTAVLVKRCHDRGKSGWFLLMNFIPLANFLVLKELWLSEGTVGDNQYGSNPLSGE
jgi:uncharacterized membrane protein YhaH (DUF805 family)